ncbi:MAG: hypothetical protein H5U40_19080 [Polyangiaceae bacterium]|nr:hypothetical protein [Polyangiaceae bacterium]
MFSTVDSNGARFLRVYLETTVEGRRAEHLIELPALEKGRHLDYLADQVRAEPSRERLRALATLVARLEFLDFVDPELESGLTISPAEGLPTRVLAANDRRADDLTHVGPHPFDGVRVEVWRYRLTPGRQELVSAPMVALRIDRAGGADQYERSSVAWNLWSM